MKDLVKTAADAAKEEGHLCVCGRPAVAGMGTRRRVQVRGERGVVWSWIRLTCVSKLVPDPNRPGIKVQDCHLLWQERERPERTAPEFRLDGNSPNFYVIRVDVEATRECLKKSGGSCHVHARV